MVKVQVFQMVKPQGKGQKFWNPPKKGLGMNRARNNCFYSLDTWAMNFLKIYWSIDNCYCPFEPVEMEITGLNSIFNNNETFSYFLYSN